MNVGDILSPGFTRSTGTKQMEAQPAISSSLFQAQSLTAKDLPSGLTVDPDGAAASDLRSVVERRFTRMNEAHDRIRTELLGAHPPQAR